MKSMKRILVLILLVTLFSGCGDDDEGSVNVQLTDPLSLSDGTAEFSVSGDENGLFESATVEWFYSGTTTVGSPGVKYARTRVVVENDNGSESVVILLYIKDPNASLFGGEEPVVGSYAVNISSDNTVEQYGGISLSADETYQSNSATKGTITIESVDNDMIKGTVDISNLEANSFSSSSNVVSLKVSFSATEL